MNDDIIKMAEACGIPEFQNNENQADNIMRFAALVRADEQKKWEGQTTIEINEAILESKEAMKLALEALEDTVDHTKIGSGPNKKAITALRAALTEQSARTLEELYALSRKVSAEQPAQQEPWSNVVIGVDVAKEGVSVTGIYKVSNDSSYLFYSQFYATQAQRQLVMNEQAMKLALSALEEAETQNDGIERWDRHKRALAALRAALVEPTSAQQEPYCYVYTEHGEDFFAPPTGYVPDDATPLYTSPPAQRKPLTDEQVKEAMMDAKLHYCGEDDLLLVRAIEAAHGIKENT